MYGKFFASTFTGSMMGAGAEVFAIWGYVIANTVEGAVELNPVLLAALLGMTPEAVSAAITKLCDTDPRSRSRLEDGRRLLPDGGFQYRVVNHAHYRAMKSEEDRRAYNREAQRRHRARADVKRVVNDSDGSSTMSAHTEADTEADPDQNHRAVARPSHDVLVRLAHTLLDDLETGRHDDPLDGMGDLAEVLKMRAAKADLVYDGASIGRALDVALAQRRRRG